MTIDQKFTVLYTMYGFGFYNYQFYSTSINLLLQMRQLKAIQHI